MDKAKLTLYWPSWQAERVRCLGNWNTIAGVAANAARLNDYYSQHLNLSAAWRIVNLCNAVRMGFSGQGLFESDLSVTVAAFRDGYSKLAADFLKQGDSYIVPTEADVRKEFTALDISTRNLIKTNLGSRLKLHSTSAHRNELRWFLDIINQL